MVCLSAKDAWRQLHNENLLEVGYTAFMKWVHKLSINPDLGIDEDALKVLRKYAEVRTAAPNYRTHQNGQAKVKVLRAIAQQPMWKGSELVQLVELHGAISRATLYRRTLDGQKFNAVNQYTAAEARKLIFGI